MQLLKTREARAAGADDALFLTIDGFLSEATTSNVFLVRRGELATPSLACAILPGTTRGWLLGWAARVGLAPHEGWLTTRDLVEADEAFGELMPREEKPWIRQFAAELIVFARKADLSPAVMLAWSL